MKKHLLKILSPLQLSKNSKRQWHLNHSPLHLSPYTHSVAGTPLQVERTRNTGSITPSSRTVAYHAESTRDSHPCLSFFIMKRFMRANKINHKLTSLKEKPREINS